MKDVVVSRISLSFSGSDNPNCFVFAAADTLTFILVIGPRRVQLGPGQVSFHPAEDTSRTAVHCLVPESLRETKHNKAAIIKKSMIIFK